MNTINKSLQRIKWRFENGKFTPNQNDVEALNFIIEWVNNDKVQMIEDNTLLAKCYVLLLKYEMLKYEDVGYASKTLSKKLTKESINQIYDEFRDALNLLDYQKFLISKGLNVNHPLQMTDEETEIEKKIIKQHESEFLQVTIDGKWTGEQVYKALNNQLTNLIKLKH